MIAGLHHIGLGVADLDNAIGFFKNVAGFSVVSQHRLDADNPLRDALNMGRNPIEVALIAGPNGYIQCTATGSVNDRKGDTVPPINTSGIRHFCIQNQDCDMLADGVRNASGNLIADPLDLGTGNQYAYARDREGNIIEIEGLPFASAEQSTWIGHVAFVTPKLDRLINFYRTILGTDLQGRSMVGPGPQSDKMSGLRGAELEGAWLPTDNMLLEFWQFHSPLSPPKHRHTTTLDLGYTHICLETDDLDHDFEQMIEAGARAICEPVENCNARTRFARDPDGNIIELLEPQKGFSQTISTLDDTKICSRTDALR